MNRPQEIQRRCRPTTQGQKMRLDSAPPWPGSVCGGGDVFVDDSSGSVGAEDPDRRDPAPTPAENDEGTGDCAEKAAADPDEDMLGAEGITGTRAAVSSSILVPRLPPFPGHMK